jgi:hypothetical protein
MEHAKPRTMARMESELIQWAVLKRSMTLLMSVVERTSATTVPVSMAACESTTAGRIAGPFSRAPRVGWDEIMIHIRRPATVAAEVRHGGIILSLPLALGSLHPPHQMGDFFVRGLGPGWQKGRTARARGRHGCMALLAHPHRSRTAVHPPSCSRISAGGKIDDLGDEIESKKLTKGGLPTRSRQFRSVLLSTSESSWKRSSAHQSNQLRGETSA